MSLGSTLSWKVLASCAWTNGASPKKRWRKEAGTCGREVQESPGIIRGEDVKKRQLGRWEFILVSVNRALFDDTLSMIQHSMINIDDGCWYAHFFRGTELIIVYQDHVFRVTTDPSS